MIKQLAATTFALLVVALLPMATGRSFELPGDEPAPAATFIAEYARGDLAAADLVASPLYRGELNGRGLSLEDRYALLDSSSQVPPRSAESLRYTFVGGVSDAGGYSHLLYTADEPGQGNRSAPTVWRVDTDSAGQVIWVEMVYMFSERTSGVRPIAAVQDDSTVPMPMELNSFHPRLLIGVRAIQGNEGYYGIGPRAQADTGHAARPSGVIFFAIDEYGDTRPGAWTFGQSRSESVVYGQVSPVATVELQSAQAKLRSSYLASLP